MRAGVGFVFSVLGADETLTDGVAALVWQAVVMDESSNANVNK